MAGTIVADTLQDGAGNSTAMDNAIYGSAKAWVNWNGASGASPTIYAAYNVSSVTRTGTGAYTLAFTNALVDANYAPVSGCNTDANNGGVVKLSGSPSGALYGKSTTALSIVACNSNNGSASDTNQLSIAIFR